HRHRQRIAPAAGHLHRRGIVDFANIDFVHDAGGLPLHGPAGRVAAAREEGRESGGNGVVNVSAPFIRRPVATTLLAMAVVLAGGAAYSLLPVAPLPRTDNPTINVQTALPGGSP